MAIIRVTEWLPDLPDYENPGGNTALNVVPKTALSYGPWKQAATLSTNALDARAQGAVSGVDYSGNVFTFAGNASKLYRYTGSTFSDVSKMGGYTTVSGYTDAVSRAWQFEQFNNVMFATNFADAVQKWTLGTDSAFSDMAATAPKARYMAVVGNHLVLANTDDSTDGHIGLRLWFSPIGNPLTNDWGNTNLQSDFRTLPKGREITGIVGGEYGIIFCRSSVYRMTYSGPPVIFSIDEINPQHGCIAPGSIAHNENKIFYLSEDGFQMMQGIQSIPIGQDKVDDFFFRNLDASQIGRIHSTIDEQRKLYLVAFPTSTSSSGTPNLVLAYNYYINRWSLIEEEVDLIDTLSSAALTLEGLGAIYTSVEDVPGTYENPAWTGGTDYLAGFNSSNQLISFAGANKGFTVDTSEAELSPGQKSVLRNVRPLTDCDCPSISIGTRNGQGEMVSFTGSVSPNSVTRLCSFRAKGRYHRARMTAPDGWGGTEIVGIDGLEFRAAGRK